MNQVHVHEISLPDGSIGKNVIIFGGELIILTLAGGPVQRLNDTTLTAEDEYYFKFTQLNRKFCLSLDYNGGNSFIFVNATKIYQFKAKDSEIKKYPLRLGNVPVDFSANNMIKTRLNGSVYNFLLIIVLLILVILSISINV